MRLSHNEVVQFCNAHLMCREGFPLALANAASNIIYADVILMLESMIAELRRLQAEQSVVDTTQNGKKR